jgi:hypothetical protein
MAFIRARSRFYSVPVEDMIKATCGEDTIYFDLGVKAEDTITHPDDIPLSPSLPLSQSKNSSGTAPVPFTEGITVWFLGPRHPPWFYRDTEFKND